MTIEQANAIVRALLLVLRSLAAERAQDETAKGVAA